MKERIKGISYIKGNKYAIFRVDYLSQEIKDVIKEELSFICYGCSASQSGYDIYNYKNTLKEFIKRYRNKTEKIQKGMIGELLTHVVFKIYFPEYKVGSPYFNKEEGSIKKGFDVILLDEYNNVYITEVKSGGIRENKTSSQSINILLDTANHDLVTRLNRKDNNTLWLSAINDAKIAFEDKRDLKLALISVLNNYSQQQVIENKDKDKDKDKDNFNVILVSSLFNPIDETVSENSIKNKYENMVVKTKFNSIFLISLQKNTYEKIFEFIKEECEDE